MHDHVRHDVARVPAPEAPAGLGLEAHDLLDRLHHAIERQLQRAGDLRIAAAAQLVEVVLHDLHRDRVRVGIALELDQQALLDRASGHAGRVERLHQREDLLDLFHRRLAALGDLGHLRPQVAVLVEIADDLVADAAHQRILGGEAQLLVEVVGERVDGAHDVLERQLLAILLGDQGALLVVVEHDRGQVERQVVGLALGRGGGGVDRRRLGRGRRGRRLRGGGRFRRVVGLGGDFLQQRILQQLLLHDFLQLERGELQQLDGLLQQRRHDDPLALP